MNAYNHYQKMLKNINSQNGITLAILVITIIVLLVIASIVLINSNAGIEQRALNNMYNDIRVLDGKISVYYEKMKELPIKYDEGKAMVALYFEEYDELAPMYNDNANKKIIDAKLYDEERNINDNEIYYVIDISKLDNMNLTYGNKTETEYTYVINEQSHTIYYLPGIALRDATYYKLPIDYEEIPINQKFTIKYKVREEIVQITSDLHYGDPTPQSPVVENVEEGLVFVGWRAESNPEVFISRNDDITKIPVEKSETYIAEISDKNQELTYELFGRSKQ